MLLISWIHSRGSETGHAHLVTNFGVTFGLICQSDNLLFHIDIDVDVVPRKTHPLVICSVT
jgi:hypothetical protein